MKKKELLRKIEALEKRVLQLEHPDIEKDRLHLPIIQQQPFIHTVPYIAIADPCYDGGHHEYPFPWGGTMSPYCKKCGKQSLNYMTVTSGVDLKTHECTYETNPYDAELPPRCTKCSRYPDKLISPLKGEL